VKDYQSTWFPYIDDELGYGFPTTFGLVIAAIVSVIGIQALVLRERRRTKEMEVQADQLSEEHV
jgi:hypothetical protein